MTYSIERDSGIWCQYLSLKGITHLIYKYNYHVIIDQVKYDYLIKLKECIFYLYGLLGHQVRELRKALEQDVARKIIHAIIHVVALTFTTFSVQQELGRVEAKGLDVYFWRNILVGVPMHGHPINILVRFGVLKHLQLRFAF